MVPTSRAAAPRGAAVCLFMAFAVAAGATAQDSAPTESRPESRPESAEALQSKSVTIGGEKPYRISGSLSASYRGRRTDDANDEDLYGYLSLDGGRPYVDDISFHLLARATFDLDRDASNTGNPFGSLNDVGRDDLDAKLYEAYVDLTGGAAPDELALRRIRLGRQNIYAGFTYLMDGARLEFDPIPTLGGLKIAAYGGSPEYLYESSRSGDWMAGADAAFRPFADTRVDLRYVHVEDENAWVGGSANDDFASFSLRQQLGETVRGVLVWNTVDAGTRDVSARLEYDDPDLGLTVKGLYKHQTTLTQEYTTPYDSYIGVLGVSYAYNQYQVEASKLFGDHFGADAGFSARFLRNRNLDGPFNREFVRGWLTLSSYSWPTDRLDLSVTGELWSSVGDDTASLGAEIGYRPTDDLRLSAGSYYSLYKHDLFVVEERTDVTSFFLRARWKFATDFRLDARYEFETGDEGDFHTATVGLTWTF